jgi:hypothetical protein
MDLPAINQRIKNLIEDTSNGSVRAFALDVGLNSSQTLNRIFNIDKRSGKYPEPSLDIISAIANKFETIDLHWLLKGGEIVKNVSEEPAPYYRTPKMITVDSQGQENVLMVPVAAQAGYLNGYDDPIYLSELPSYRLPKVDNGTYRMFEVKGHSMHPTIHSGSVAVGEWCENWEQDMKDNSIYILVSKDDGITIKRCINRIAKYGNIYAKSDNRREYPSFPVKPEELLEVWKLKTALIFDFQDPADLYDRVSDLEAEIMHLKA